jgi:hypothetical protein
MDGPTASTAAPQPTSDIPDHGIALAFTSPSYNVGKVYEEDASLEGYLGRSF